MNDKKPNTPKKVKGDKNKPFDVIVTVVHDDRVGHTNAAGPVQRYSYATVEEALEVSNKIKELLA